MNKTKENKMNYNKETLKNAQEILNDPEFLTEFFFLKDAQTLHFLELEAGGEQLADTNMAVMMRKIPMPPGKISKLAFHFATVMMRYKPTPGKENSFDWGWVGLMPEVKGWIGACMIVNELEWDKWYWMTVKDVKQEKSTAK